MDSRITVTARAHWLNAWFIYPLARPVLGIDGMGRFIRWSRPETVAVLDGTHTVSGVSSWLPATGQ